jgi:hypothetical protein
MSGDATAGGILYQARAIALVYVHILAQSRLDWFPPFDDTPVSIAGDPEGHWPGHYHSWLQSPSSRGSNGAGCGRCSGDIPCEATCLRATHPHLADPAEWDYLANGLMTPDNVTHGSQKKAQWLCALHGPYRQEIRTRATTISGCRECQKIRSKAKRLETQRAKRKENRALAELGRYIANATPEDLTPPSDDDLFD